LRILAAVMSGLCFMVMAGDLLVAQEKEMSSKTGFYFSLATNVTGAFDVKTTSPVLSPGKTEAGRGIGIDGGLGYRFGDFRVEGEFLYDRNDADRVSFTGGGGALSGYYDMLGATLNFFYDVPTGTRLRPYVGAGLGGIHLDAHDITLAGFPPTQGSNGLFAYKFLAGVSYTLTDTWRLFLGYRFMGMGKQDYVTGGIPLYGDPLRLHSLQAGIQFHL
jgi:OmpA-OmpF porin, OOP family